MKKKEPKELILSYSSLKMWRRCRYKYWLRYLEGYKPEGSSPGLMRGSAGHAALAYWYSSGSEDDEGAIDKAWEVFSSPGELVGNAEEEFELLEEALGRYFEWARDKDRWEVLDIEREFKISVDERLALLGYIDMFVMDKKQMWIVENKFLKRVQTRHLDMDPQVSTYMLGAMALGFKPVGVIYNIIRIGSGPTAKKEPVVRLLQYRNPEGLRGKLREIIMQSEEVQEFWDDGGRIYRNETKDCSWDCSFFEVCLSITDSGNGEDVLKTMQRRD